MTMKLWSLAAQTWKTMWQDWKQLIQERGSFNTRPYAIFKKQRHFYWRRGIVCFMLLFLDWSQNRETLCEYLKTILTVEIDAWILPLECLAIVDWLKKNDHFFMMCEPCCSSLFSLLMSVNIAQRCQSWEKQIVMHIPVFPHSLPQKTLITKDDTLFSSSFESFSVYCLG